MHPCLPLTVFGLGVLAGPVHAQEPIGERGARVELPDEGWTRRVFDPDLSKDQFLAPGERGWFSAPAQVFFVVVEIESLLETEADVERCFAVMAQVGDGAPVEIVRKPGELRASRKARARVNGIDLEYRFEVVAGAGSAHMVVAWSGGSASG